jgi:hypothetical protein
MGVKPDLSPEKRNVGYESDSKENEPEGEEINKTWRHLSNGTSVFSPVHGIL